LQVHTNDGVAIVTYALDQHAEWRASEVETQGLTQSFTVYHHGEPQRRFEIALPIRHNVQNALGAIVVCRVLGLELNEIAGALSTYGGVRRRFELVGESEGVLVYDDYAHHPTEIADTATAAKVHFPGRRIVALFQPHTYARTRYLLDGFRTCFRDFDRLFLLETYAAREAIGDGMTAAQLAKEIRDPVPGYAETFDEAADLVAEELRSGDVFFTVGAGDVDSVGPKVLERLRRRGDGAKA
jgi:UDP-N-acetylmuramate--alanine ligase